MRDDLTRDEQLEKAKKIAENHTHVKYTGGKKLEVVESFGNLTLQTRHIGSLKKFLELGLAIDQLSTENGEAQFWLKPIETKEKTITKEVPAFK